jgi:uncharacterized membrane protein
MAIIYIVAGIFHFIKPKVYLRIMPRFLPAHCELVFLSGVAEVILGIGLLFPQTKNYSLYGIILMLIIFLLVHFYMLSSKKAGAGFPIWALALRIPLQFLLIWWAWHYLSY